MDTVYKLNIGLITGVVILTIVELFKLDDFHLNFENDRHSYLGSLGLNFLLFPNRLRCNTLNKKGVKDV